MDTYHGGTASKFYVKYIFTGWLSFSNYKNNNLVAFHTNNAAVRTCASLKLGEFSSYLATKKSRKLVMLGYLLLIEWSEACIKDHCYWDNKRSVKCWLTKRAALHILYQESSQWELYKMKWPELQRDATRAGDQLLGIYLASKINYHMSHILLRKKTKCKIAKQSIIKF